MKSNIQVLFPVLSSFTPESLSHSDKLSIRKTDQVMTSVLQVRVQGLVDPSQLISSS